MYLKYKILITSKNIYYIGNFFVSKIVFISKHIENIENFRFFEILKYISNTYEKLFNFLCLFCFFN